MGSVQNKLAITAFVIPYVGVILSEAQSAESKDLNTESDVSTALRSAQHDDATIDNGQLTMNNGQ